MIAQWQIEQFHQQGYLVVEGVLSAADIATLQSDFDGWVEESRRHASAWGKPSTGGRASISSATMLPTIRRCAGSPPRRRSPKRIAILRSTRG